jgi:hypothetical protein
MQRDVVVWGFKEQSTHGVHPRINCSRFVFIGVRLNEYGRAADLWDEKNRRRNEMSIKKRSSTFGNDAGSWKDRTSASLRDI